MKISVFYDAVCPSCVKSREQYCRLSDISKTENVEWLDINSKNLDLSQYGIEPLKALTELHIKIEHEDGSVEILSELDAYIVLMQRITLLKPLAIIIALPFVRPLLSKSYALWVHRRLKAQGRI